MLNSGLQRFQTHARVYSLGFFPYFWPPNLAVKRTDNTSVNVFAMKGTIFANSDSPFMNEIDPDTLQLLDNVSTARADIKGASKYSKALFS